ncbi:hypothetical protein ACFSFY_07590 [Sporosarcina siberiensis]|uniref:YesK-like protein n=1 Tax=Sporosarcina siberiensis TaxID=1365606 RepID=A0ABW4SEU3_9BACL
MEKDKVIVLFDYLILFTYLIFIVFICLLLTRFLIRRNVDYLVCLLAVASITLFSSLAILKFGYENSGDAPFFQIVMTASLILLTLLFVAIIIKNIWPDKYEQVVPKFQFMQKKEEKAPHMNK